MVHLSTIPSNKSLRVQRLAFSINGLIYVQIELKVDTNALNVHLKHT